jgi:signal transduction histidine kinase/CheY-like chemotaxis protein
MLALDQIRSHIHDQEMVLKAVVRNVNLANMDRAQQHLVLSKLLFSSADGQHRDIFEDIVLLDGKGKESARVSRSAFLEDADLGDRSRTDEFKIPSSSGEVYYSPVFFDTQSGEPFMRMSIPVTDPATRQLRGMLVADIRMKFMWDLIASIHLGDSGRAYVADQHGRIIAHRNPSVVLRGTHFRVPQRSGIATGLNGTRAVLAAEKMQLGRESFYVITELPAAEALHYTYRTLFAFAAFLVLTLLCAAAIGVVLIRKVVRPIESLAVTAQAISNGDFSQKAGRFRNDETGALADAFNVMTFRLLETITSLNEQIAERKRAEEKVLRQNDLMHNIMNSLTNPFYVIDARTYTIMMANSAAHFGDLGEPRKCYALTHRRDEPCDGVEHPCTIREVIKAGKPVVLEHAHYDSLGQPSFYNVYGYPIFDGDGNVSQVIEYTIDITDRKKLEEQLLQAQKMEAIGNLAGGIAHDFNNLLCAIIGYSEMLLEKIPPDDPAYEKVSIIMDAGRKAETLTRQLLAFGRRQILEIKVINLNDVVENMTKILGRVIGENIKLEINTRPSIRNVKADPGQIEQVLMNLAVNARDAMLSGGRLIIETEDVELDEEYARSHASVKAGPYVMLAVTDSGLGMGREVREKIFEPFFTTKGDKGTGLGLSTVYGIVKQHGGNIYVYSEPGVGSTFKIYLPSTGETKEKPASGEQEPAFRGAGTILVVDDEPSVRRLIVDVLQLSGYRLLEASSGTEALRIAREAGVEIDILLTDLVMPDMNGTELARTFRKDRPSTSVIVMSGYTDSALFSQEMLDEKTAFLQKPISPRKLVSKLASVFNEAVRPKQVAL